MNWVVLALSLAGMLALAGVVWAWRFRRDRRVESPEEAAEAAEDALPGFRTSGAVVGADGAAALVVDGGGRVAVCRRQGKRLAVREVAWSAIRAGADGLTVETGERRFGAVTVAGVDALDVRRLSLRSPGA